MIKILSYGTNVTFRAKGGTSVANEEVDETAIRLALEQMKLMDVLKGKSGIGGKNKKEIGEHKFWSTQPVPQLGEYSCDFIYCVNDFL